MAVHSLGARHPDQELPTEFGKRLTEHLTTLGWTQGRLATEASISPAQLSGWIKSQSRMISRHHVCRLAAAIAGGYERAETKHKPNWGYDQLDALLNDLLLAAGFAAVLGRPTDSVWQRLLAEDQRSKVLRVGWTHYYPFSYSAGVSKAKSEEVDGIAIEITSRVAELTGLQLQWIYCEWGQIEYKLRSGEIDLMCPVLMLLPTRAVQHILFSKPVYGIALAVNGLAHKEHISTARQASQVGLSLERTKSVKANSIEGEVGDILKRIILPRSSPGYTYDTQDQAARDILEHPTDESGRSVKCLVADHTICHQLIIDFGDQLELLYPNANESPVKLPIAFGAHADEPKLIEIVNTSLGLIKASGTFHAILRKYAIELADYGVITRTDGNRTDGDGRKHNPLPVSGT